MGKHKDLSEFGKGQTVMARRLGQSFSKTAVLVGCSRSALVSISWILFSFTYVDGQVHVRRLPGELIAPECTMERRQARAGSVMLWAMFYWETLGRGCYFDMYHLPTVKVKMISPPYEIK